jgi:ankyrin repeat protein
MLKPISKPGPMSDTEFLQIFIDSVLRNNEQMLRKAIRKMVQEQSVRQIQASYTRDLKDFTRWHRMIQSSLFERFVFFVMFMDEKLALDFIDDHWQRNPQQTKQMMIDAIFNDDNHPIFAEHLGSNTLILCINEVRPTLVRWLLDHKCDPNGGCTMHNVNPISNQREKMLNIRPITTACVAEAWTIVDLLLAAGADINASSVGYTEGSLAESTVLIQLIRLNKMAAFREVLKRGVKYIPMIITTPNANQTLTPILCALHRKKIAFIPELIKHFKLSLYDQSIDEKSTHCDLSWMVQLLTFEQLLWVFEQSGLRLLDFTEIPVWCAWFNKPVFTELREIGFTLTECDTRDTVIKGYTPLHAAIARGHDRCIVQLLTEKKELANLPATDGSLCGTTPLYLAVTRHQEKTARLLLINSANPLQLISTDTTDATIDRSLVTAIENNCTALAIAMIHACSNNISQLTTRQRNEIIGCYYQARLNQPKIARAIQSRYQFDLKNIRKVVGETCLPFLFLATKHSDLRFFQFVFEDSPVEDHTFNIEERDTITILMQACLLNRKDIVKFLLSHGIRNLPNVQSIFWLYMLRMTNADIINLIITECKSSFDINQLIYDEHNRGYTAVQWAIIEERADLLTVLLKHHADLLRPDSGGDNTWTLAYERYLFYPSAICILLMHVHHASHAFTDLILLGTTPLCAAIVQDDRPTAEFLLTQQCSLTELCAAGPYVGKSAHDLLAEKTWGDLKTRSQPNTVHPANPHTRATDSQLTSSYHSLNNHHSVFFRSNDQSTELDNTQLLSFISEHDIVPKLNYDIVILQRLWLRLLSIHRDDADNNDTPHRLLSYQLSLQAVRFFEALSRMTSTNSQQRKLSEFCQRVAKTIRDAYPCAPMTDLRQFIQVFSAQWQKLIQLIEANNNDALTPMIDALHEHPAVKQLGNMANLTMNDNLVRMITELKFLARVMHAQHDYIRFKNNPARLAFCQSALITIHKLTTQMNVDEWHNVLSTILAKQPQLRLQSEALHSFLAQCQPMDANTQRNTVCARIYRLASVTAPRLMNSELFNALDALTHSEAWSPLILNDKSSSMTPALRLS